MSYVLKDYEEQLNHQVIHMDQAVCYCPEFRATCMMAHYPSRKLQLTRAVMKEELPLTDYIGDLAYQSILSRQGERWQNFHEDPEDCTDAMILSRAMLLEKGYHSPAVADFKAAVAGKTAVTWTLPVDANSDTAILLDASTATLDSAGFQAYCEKTGLSFKNQAVSQCTGFGYFAYGLVAEGTARLKELVAEYQALGVKKVVTLSACATYMLTTFAPKVGLSCPFEVEYLPTVLAPITSFAEKKTYVYAGSFNLRYLGNASLLNQLVPATDETMVPRSQEFTPLLQGTGRINRLTIWQKPVGAEYPLFGVDAKLVEGILADAVADITFSQADTILVFEPTAMEVLTQAFPDKNVVYYLDCI